MSKKESDSLKQAHDRVLMSGYKKTHSEDGVDVTLIRWMLSMTPADRLQTLQHTVWSIMRLLGAKYET